ncbi:MAG: GtrA family protein [Clostridia bacterium]|nr:GtrA family protein [Clostridia bacterium]
MRVFIKNFLEKTILDKTFWKFLLVGVLNTIVGLGVNVLLLFLLEDKWSVDQNTAYWIASAGNYIVGSILSFFLNKYFTFKSNAKSFSEVLRFIINIVVCWVIAYGIAKPLVWLIFTKTWVFPWQNVEVPAGDNTAKVISYVATLVGAGLFVILNYFGQRFFAFKKKDDEEVKDENKEQEEEKETE